MKIPMRMALIAAETQQRLKAEIADLQQQLDEIDEFLAAGRAERAAEKAVTNVPQGTPATTPEPLPTNDAPFESEAYTAMAVKNLPEKFDTQVIIDALIVTKKQTHSLITTWTRRRWIERTSYGHYRKTAIFGSSSDTAHLQPESAPPVHPNKIDQLKARLLHLRATNLIRNPKQKTNKGDQDAHTRQKQHHHKRRYPQSAVRNLVIHNSFQLARPVRSSGRARVTI